MKGIKAFMLIVEIKVNGEKIGNLYIQNKGRVISSKGEDIRLYKFRYNNIDEPSILGEFTHNRNDGALILIRDCIDLIEAFKKK